MIFLMPIYFVICLVAIIFILKRYRGKHKWLMFFMLSFLFYLPVGWDVVLGRAYFYYLCHNDGGIHVYKTVTLGAENWSKDGSPKFYTDKGDFNEAYFNGAFELAIHKDNKFKTILPIIRWLYQIINVNNGEVLGEEISYVYTNGWVMMTYQPFNVRGKRCPVSDDYKDNSDAIGKGSKWYRKFHSYVFLNENN